MSTEVIGIFPKGTAKIPDNHGHPMTVDVFAFRTVTNEAAPEDVLAFCLPCYTNTMIKNLRRLIWVKPEKQVEGTKADHLKVARGEEEIVKAQNNEPAVFETETARANYPRSEATRDELKEDTEIQEG